MRKRPADWWIEALLKSPPQRRYKPPKGKRTQPDKEIAPEVIAEIKEARRALVAYHANKRRAARVQQTPKWADDSAMRFLYLEASRLSRETGVQHHVDHVIPLQGDNVSGLHTPENMRVIPAAENIRKSNKFDGVDE